MAKTDFPDDVKVAAMDAYIAYVESHKTDITKDPTEAELLAIVAAAIVAERERCVAVLKPYTTAAWKLSLRNIASKCIDAIRKGSE